MVFNILSLFPGSLDNEAVSDDDTSLSFIDDFEERINEKAPSTLRYYSSSALAFPAVISAAVGTFVAGVLRGGSCKEKSCKIIESDWPEIFKEEEKQLPIPGCVDVKSINETGVRQLKESPVQSIRSEAYFAKPLSQSQSSLSETEILSHSVVLETTVELESEEAMLGIEEVVREGERRRQNRRMQSDHDHKEWRNFLARTGLGKTLGIDN